jgi:hypothetical protein
MLQFVCSVCKDGNTVKMSLLRNLNLVENIAKKCYVCDVLKR